MAKDKGLLNRTIIASFYHDVMMYVQDTYPDAYRGASRKEFVTFYFAALFNIKNYHPTFVAMQAPHDSFVDSFGANFATARTLNYAHEHGIALQYWTVNNPNEMRYLVNIKADGIISDYPQTLYDIKKRILGDNVWERLVFA